MNDWNGLGHVLPLVLREHLAQQAQSATDTRQQQTQQAAAERQTQQENAAAARQQASIEAADDRAQQAAADRAQARAEAQAARAPIQQQATWREYAAALKQARSPTLTTAQRSGFQTQANALAATLKEPLPFPASAPKAAAAAAPANSAKPPASNASAWIKANLGK
jgi:hypothetical protein